MKGWREQQDVDDMARANYEAAARADRAERLVACGFLMAFGLGLVLGLFIGKAAF